MKRIALLAVLAAGFLAVTAADAQQKLKGDIKIDGSSTVYLITEAVATNFKKLHSDVNITVGISGTGGGFKKFYNGETDISDASRAIKAAEAELCKKNGIEYLELQVAWDGLAVIINKDNNWAKQLTMEQLRKIWHPDNEKTVTKWSDVDPKWPAEPLRLYGAGSDSGTFDYFTEAVNGKEKLIRTDYKGSEDDNVTIKGVQGSKYAMGFLGVAYYEQHKDQLGVVSIAAKQGESFMPPNADNVLSRKYPISRPLFIYIKKASLKRPEVREFAKFYMRRDDLVSAVKYVPLNAFQQVKEQKKLEQELKVVK